MNFSGLTNLRKTAYEHTVYGTREGLPLTQETYRIEVTKERCVTYIVKKGINLMGRGIVAFSGLFLGGCAGRMLAEKTSMPDGGAVMLMVGGMFLGAGMGSIIGDKITSTMLNCCCKNEKRVKIL